MSTIQCVICSSNYTQSDQIITTPCGHIYHNGCLSQWLSHSETCPQCRNVCRHIQCGRVFFNFDGEDESMSKIEVSNLLDETLKENGLLNSSLGEQKQLNAVANKKLKEIERDLSAMSARQCETEEIKNELQCHLTKKINTIKELNEKCANITMALDKTQRDLSEFKTQYRSNIAKYKENSDKLSNELKLCQGMLHEVNGQLDKTEKMSVGFQWELVQKENVLEELNEKCFSGSREMEKLRKTIDELERQLDQAEKISVAQQWKLVLNANTIKELCQKFKHIVKD